MGRGESFRDGIASHTKGENKKLPSLDAVPERAEGRRRQEMYTGTLINDLMATVERVESRARQQSQEDRLAYWYALAQQEMAQFESTLAGVA
jgi:hypothetical protein